SQRGAGRAESRRRSGRASRRSCTMLRVARSFLVCVALLLAAVAVAAPASGRTILLGRSWQGRPISAVEVGNPSGRRVLVVGCIHGNETGGIPIARMLERVSPHDLDLWIVPDLNPDGVAADTRQNAHGVGRGLRLRPAPLVGAQARIAHA